MQKQFAENLKFREDEFKKQIRRQEELNNYKTDLKEQRDQLISDKITLQDQVLQVENCQN
jgi:hypothetical protein